MTLPKSLNSSGRVFHRVDVAAKNALSPIVFLVVLGRSSSKCFVFDRRFCNDLFKRKFPVALKFWLLVACLFVWKVPLLKLMVVDNYLIEIFFLQETSSKASIRYVSTASPTKAGSRYQVRRYPSRLILFKTIVKHAVLWCHKRTSCRYYYLF